MNEIKNPQNPTQIKTKTGYKLMVWAVLVYSAAVLGVIPAYTLIKPTEFNALFIGEGPQNSHPMWGKGEIADLLVEDQLANYPRPDGGWIETKYQGQKIDTFGVSSCSQDFSSSAWISWTTYDRQGNLIDWWDGLVNPCDVGVGTIAGFNISADESQGLSLTYSQSGRSATSKNLGTSPQAALAKSGSVASLDSEIAPLINYRRPEGGRIEIIFVGLTESSDNVSVCEERYPYKANFRYTEYNQAGEVIPPGEEEIQTGFCNKGDKIEVLKIDDENNSAGPVLITIPKIISPTQTSNGPQANEQVKSGALVNLINLSEYNQVSFIRRDGSGLKIEYLGLQKAPGEEGSCYDTFPNQAILGYQEFDDERNMQPETQVIIGPCPADSGNIIQVYKIGDSQTDEVLITVAEGGPIDSD